MKKKVCKLAFDLDFTSALREISTSIHLIAPETAVTAAYMKLNCTIAEMYTYSILEIPAEGGEKIVNSKFHHNTVHKCI
jgi:hypothetical protein